METIAFKLSNGAIDVNTDRNAAIGIRIRRRQSTYLLSRDLLFAAWHQAKSAKRWRKEHQHANVRAAARNPREGKATSTRIIHRGADITTNARKNMRLSQTSDTITTFRATHRRRSPKTAMQPAMTIGGKVLRRSRPEIQPRRLERPRHHDQRAPRKSGAPLTSAAIAPCKGHIPRKPRGQRPWPSIPDLTASDATPKDIRTVK